MKHTVTIELVVDSPRDLEQTKAQLQEAMEHMAYRGWDAAAFDDDSRVVVTEVKHQMKTFTAYSEDPDNYSNANEHYVRAETPERAARLWLDEMTRNELIEIGEDVEVIVSECPTSGAEGIAEVRPTFHKLTA